MKKKIKIKNDCEKPTKLTSTTSELNHKIDDAVPSPPGTKNDLTPQNLPCVEQKSKTKTDRMSTKLTLDKQLF